MPVTSQAAPAPPPPSDHAETLDLPPFRSLVEDSTGNAQPPLPLLSLPATLEPISRPSSTSSQLSLPQLPGISSLASGTPASGSPQLRATNVPAQNYNTGQSPAATTGGGGANLPTCQNCSTSTTPLWRRDDQGSVLCNACGLFLKLHSRPRPISLKTDVIKSRNRVKTARSDITVKKKAIPLVIEANAFDGNHAHNGAGGAASGPRRLSAKSVNGNGHTEGSHSPISRTATPSVYPNLPLFHGMDDAASQFASQSASGSTSLPAQTAFNNASGSSPGRSGSPLNGDRANLDVPQTQEQMLLTIGSLKTRVSELEVINELFRSRVAQVEQEQQAKSRTIEQQDAVIEQMRRTQSDLQAKLDDSHRRENLLKRRLDELEIELKETKDSLEAQELSRKKLRVSDMVGDSDASTPQSGV